MTQLPPGFPYPPAPPRPGARDASRWSCWRDPRHPVAPHRVFGWPQCTVCQAAPAYHERPDYLPEGFTLTIYVPTQDAGPVCAPGSGIVGLPPAAERTTVYFEGWIHGAHQYANRDARGRWEAGVEHAASRMVTAYPTVACASVRAEHLRPVGTHDPRTRTVAVTDEDAVAAWVAGNPSGT